MASLPRRFRPIPAVPVVAESTPDFSSLSIAIINWDANDFDARLKTLVLDLEATEYLVNTSIPDLVKGYGTSSGKHQTIALTMLRKLLVVLGDQSCIVNLILRNAAATDSRYRILSISLMRLVTDPAKLRNPIFSLALDRVPSVRCALVRALPELVVDAATVDSVLKNAACDKSDFVRTATARVIVTTAPHLTAEFGGFLRSEGTVKAALEGLPAMVAANSFAQFYEALAAAIELDPDAAADAFVKCAASLKEEDQVLAWMCAEQLGTNRVFLRNLFVFSERFADQHQFLQFLDVKRAPEWRDRYIMLQQAILFVPMYAAELVDLAAQFADDEIAIIRDASVQLWVELIRTHQAAGKALGKLLTAKWQTRLVTAKVIGEIGIFNGFEQMAEKLGKDDVENVRFCLATRIKASPWFARLFGQTDGAAMLQII